MTKNELVYTVAHQAQMTRIAAAAAVNTTFEVIITSLKNGAEVRISGFGKFSILRRAKDEVQPESRSRLTPQSSPDFRPARA